MVFAFRILLPVITSWRPPLIPPLQPRTTRMAPTVQERLECLVTTAIVEWVWLTTASWEVCQYAVESEGYGRHKTLYHA